MAQSEATINYGFILKRGDGVSPQTFYEIPEVTNITEFGQQRDLLETTHSGSPDASKEYVSGMKDGSELTVECNYIGGSQQLGLKTDQDTGVVRDFQLIFTQDNPDTYFNFSATVLGWSLGATQPNSVRKINFRLKISGEIF